MRLRTIKEWYQDKEGITPEHYQIYLVRANDVVLYIGQAENTHNRLQTHLGLAGRSTGRPNTPLGECIIAHLPTSGEWIFEEYTLEDCNDITMTFRDSTYICQHFPSMRDLPFNVEQTEEAMIKHYHPCLNVACNPNPTPLPAHLEWRDGREPFNEFADAVGANIGIR